MGMLRLAVFNVVAAAACHAATKSACIPDGQCSQCPEEAEGKDCCSHTSHRTAYCGKVEYTRCGPTPKDFNETMLEVVAPAGCQQKHYGCPLLPSGKPDPKSKFKCCHGLVCTGGGGNPPTCELAFAKKIAEKDSTEIAVKLDEENLHNANECWSRKSVYDYRSCLLCCVDPASGPHVNCPAKCQNHYNAVVLQEEVGRTAVGQCTKYKHPAQQLCSDCCVPKHGGSICHHTYDCGGIDALEWYRCGPSPMDYESNLTLV